MNINIRKERESDVDAIHALNISAFETDAEANLVDVLREAAATSISLVADKGGIVVGHILFTPVLADAGQVEVMGLAPMAVSPNCQRQGVGSALVQAGLEACRAQGAQAVVVLGHPDYYPRFGFTDSKRFDIRSEYDVPEGAFMVLELVPDALRPVSGIVRYHEAFGAI